MLPRDVKNVEYIDGSDLAHSSLDEEESKGLPINKTMTEKVQLDNLDTKLKFGPKVKLAIGSGFKEFDVPNLSKSLSQIEEVMDQGKLKKGKRNVCYPALGNSPRKTRRCELAKASKLPKKSRKKS
jgi:signal recognition particle GTPase